MSDALPGMDIRRLAARVIKAGPERLPQTEGFAWTEVLSLEERRSFCRELVSTLQRSGSDLIPRLEAICRSWYAAAKAARAARLSARMSVPTQESGTARLPHP